MVHVALAGDGVEPVDLLGVARGAQGADVEDLGLTADEEARAVRAGQDAHFAGDGADLVELAAIDAQALLGDELAEDLLLEVVEHVADELGLGGDQLTQLAVLGLTQEGLADLGRERVDVLLAGFLVGVLEGLGHAGHVLAGEGDQALIELGGLDVELLLADLLDDLFLPGAELAHRVPAHFDRLEHFGLGHELDAGLDHHDGVRGARDHQVHVALVGLGEGRVDHPLIVDAADANATDGAREGNVGDHQGRRGAEHGEHVGLDVLIARQHVSDDLHVVAEAIREEGADRTVDQTPGQDGVLGGATLAAHEAAGDAADRVHLLFVVDQQGEEVDALAGGLRHGRRHQHGGAARLDQDGTARLLGVLAEGHRDVVVAELVTISLHFVAHGSYSLLFTFQSGPSVRETRGGAVLRCEAGHPRGGPALASLVYLRRPSLPMIAR
ncbi:hypothetical protein D3C86_1136240 [compost metagenome]